MNLDHIQELMIEAVEHFWKQKEPVSVIKIVDYLDGKYNFDKRTYSNLKHKVYYRIKNSRRDVLAKFLDYQETKDYQSKKQKLIYYDNAPDTVPQEQFHSLIQYGFSPEQVDSLYYDTQIFNLFIGDQIQNGTLFLVPNENNEYLIPSWTDYVIYRFGLIGKSAKRIHTQIVQFNNDKYILPTGQIVDQLTMNADKLKQLTLVENL